jgi:hypothetical protein
MERVSQCFVASMADGIDDIIGAFVRRKNNKGLEDEDEYERWKTQEPEWSREQYLGDGHSIVYWIQMRSKYPCLSHFAIDMLTIPASSCDYQRLFSELGDLLEPKRRAIGSELLAALQLLRSWTRAGFKTQDNKSAEGNNEDDVSDEHIVQVYNIHKWIIEPL